MRAVRLNFQFGNGLQIVAIKSMHAFLVLLALIDTTKADERVTKKSFEKSFESPDKKLRVDYVIKYTDSGVEQVAALKSGKKVLWSYSPPDNSRGLYFSWAPSSNCFLMACYTDAKDMDLWLLVIVNDAIRMIDLDLGTIYEKLDAILPEIKELLSSAPSSGIEWDSIQWTGPKTCKMIFYLWGLGKTGEAQLSLDAAEDRPKLKVLKMTPSMPPKDH